MTDANTTTKILYARVDEYWRKEDKYRHLDSKEHYQNMEWRPIAPDKRYTWFTEGLRAEFETFVPMGNKAAKAGRNGVEGTIFKTYSRGIITCRDTWAFNFNRNALIENMRGLIDTYNLQVFKWEHRENRDVNVDNFVAMMTRKSSGVEI